MSFFRLSKNDQFRGLRENPNFSAKLRLFDSGLVSFERAIDILHEYIISICFSSLFLIAKVKTISILLLFIGKSIMIFEDILGRRYPSFKFTKLKFLS
jgi:hypothetical protein